MKIRVRKRQASRQTRPLPLNANAVPNPSASLPSYPQGIDALLEVILQIDVVSVEVLFPSTGSPVELLTEATFGMSPACLGVTTMVKVAVAPSASPPILHKTVPPNRPHDPALAVAETKSMPAGNGSVTSTLSAASGPLFVTVMV